MIIAKRKPFDEIVQAAAPFPRIGGGLRHLRGGLPGRRGKEAGHSGQLNWTSPPRWPGASRPFEVACVERQCDREFLDELAEASLDCDAMLSMACGAGIQFLAERFPTSARCWPGWTPP
jgi:hypothetical protein